MPLRMLQWKAAETGRNKQVIFASLNLPLAMSSLGSGPAMLTLLGVLKQAI